MSREREGPSLEQWVPKTQLGKMVQEGKITSIQEIFNEGYKVKEVEVIDFLVPNLKDEVIDISLVQ
ncbi:30S ribosomal protein S5, partial [Candidatus Bathyarchaeota archaeon]|nr:30S ribosomal protein S5 [Candidatus Bathyarchaeota archaeon]